MRQRHAHLPAAGKRPDVAVNLVVLEAETVQHFAGLRLQRVATEMFVLLLHFAEVRQRAVHVIRALGIAHGMVEGFELMVQIAGAPASGDGLIEDQTALHFLDVLTEVADGELLRNRETAFVGIFLADDHAEKGGLAGAVGTHQADLLPGVQLKGCVYEDELPAVLLVDIGKGDQTTKLADDPDRHFRRFIERFLREPDLGAARPGARRFQARP